MNRPVLTRDKAILIADNLLEGEKVFLLGIRGFIDPAKGNKRGVYDDAVFLVTEDGVEGFTFNTDPSVDRKGIAVLQPGKYAYTQGLHGVHHLDTKNDLDDRVLYNTLIAHHKDVDSDKGKLTYWAFRQAGPVLLLRDGKTTPETDGWPSNPAWIDIHRGGVNTTSSEGCQTVLPDEWLELRDKGYAAMDKNAMHQISYILVEKTEDMDL